jgi:hypothetical protein
MDYLLPESNMAESSSGPSSLTASEFVEMSMVLPTWQMNALADLAARQGMTIGQLLRRSITRLVREGEDAAQPQAA